MMDTRTSIDRGFLITRLSRSVPRPAMPIRAFALTSATSVPRTLRFTNFEPAGLNVIVTPSVDASARARIRSAVIRPSSMLIPEIVEISSASARFGRTTPRTSDSTDPSVKTVSAKRNVRLVPKRSPAQPLNGITTARLKR